MLAPHMVFKAFLIKTRFFFMFRIKRGKAEEKASTATIEAGGSLIKCISDVE